MESDRKEGGFEIMEIKYEITIHLNGSKVTINRWAHTAHEAIQSIKHVLRNPGFVEFVDIEDNLTVIKTENICKITIE